MNSPDQDQLNQFSQNGDEAAFEVLMQRHGPMVLGVCQRVLDDPHEAKDAFQAVFLVLARKASVLVRHPNLAGWLHQTALRTALKLRTRRVIRGQREVKLSEEIMADSPAHTASTDAGDDVRGMLDEELCRLPERYRLPLVLAYFEQQSYDQIGQALGLPFDTVKNRLARGRDLLRKRLLLRRATVSDVALGTLLARHESTVALPGLTKTTIAVARDFASGTAVASATVSANALLLAEEMTLAVATGTAFTTTITSMGATFVKTKLIAVATVLVPSLSAPAFTWPEPIIIPNHPSHQPHPRMHSRPRRQTHYPRHHSSCPRRSRSRQENRQRPERPPAS